MMPHAQYKRLSPATFDPPVHLAEHTHEKQLATSQASQIRSKKQSLGHSTTSRLPAAFWDNLSRIWLTKQALRELDRRNNQAAPNPPYPPHRRIRRPVTPILATKYLRLCTPSILKDIKLLARHGGPDLSDLRNCPQTMYYPQHTMGSSRLGSQSRLLTPATFATPQTTKLSKSTGVYDRDFQQHLVDNSIYPPGYWTPGGSAPAQPDNWEQFQQILAQPRPSLAPSQFSDKDFREFRERSFYARKEKQVSEHIIPIIEGKTRDAGNRAGGIPFTNLDPLTDGTLKSGNPDIYYGARPEQLSQKVRNDPNLRGRIIPSTQRDLPLVPNSFLAVKGPSGSIEVAKRQACYDGALGARGMHNLRSYGRAEPVYDNNAYTITSTYHDGNLKMYTSHVAPPREPGGHPEYYMHQLDGWCMDGNPETFRRGATAYRNGRDWAKEQRDEAIRQANERVNSRY